MKKLIISTALAALVVAPAYANKQLCKPAVKETCSVNGCARSDPGGFFSVVDFDTGSFERCEKGKDCDAYVGHTNTSGVMKTVTLINKAAFIRVVDVAPVGMDMPAGSYVEVLSQLTFTVTYWGVCEDL